MPIMSIQTTDSEPKTPLRQRLGAKLKAALDSMVWDGLPYAEAARKANLTTYAMRCALDRSHVQAYLRSQRQVFRASLTDRATFRMVELSEQDDNRAAAFSATSKLMNEHDQQVSSGNQRHAPGLVVQIINSVPLAHELAQPALDVQVIDNIDVPSRDE